MLFWVCVCVSGLYPRRPSTLIRRSSVRLSRDSCPHRLSSAALTWSSCRSSSRPHARSRRLVRQPSLTCAGTARPSMRPNISRTWREVRVIRPIPHLYTRPDSSFSDPQKRRDYSDIQNPVRERVVQPQGFRRTFAGLKQVQSGFIARLNTRLRVVYWLSQRHYPDFWAV